MVREGGRAGGREEKRNKELWGVHSDYTHKHILQWLYWEPPTWRGLHEQKALANKWKLRPENVVLRTGHAEANQTDPWVADLRVEK
jgi:hypothetical protein